MATTAATSSVPPRQAATGRAISQTVVFTGSTMVGNGLAAVAKVLLARVLSVASFGVYSFALSFLQFAALFFEFGFFQPAARLTALADRRESREIIGAALLVFVPVAIAFGLFVVGASFVVDSVFRVHAGAALRGTAPLAFVFAASFVGLALAQGVGRAHLSAMTNVCAQLVFAGLLGLISIVSWHLTVTEALVARCATLALGTALLVFLLRPLLANARRHVLRLREHARRYGFQIYVGRVFSIGTYNMDVLMLGVWTDARAVGLYTLAGAVAAGLNLPINAFATVLFRRMVHSRRLERSWLLAGWAIGAATVVGAVLLGGVAIRAVFSSSYSGAAVLLVPLVLAEAIRGITSLYNSFLSAQGRGVELRNAGIVLTVSNLILNFALIPSFGAKGAAWASFGALLANLAAHRIGYRRAVEAGPVL
jgi:O-antigen/teichoic acid export membrane protein